jgi:hypothetical protein
VVAPVFVEPVIVEPAEPAVPAVPVIVEPVEDGVGPPEPRCGRPESRADA